MNGTIVATAVETQSVIRDEDTDSLSALPMGILPLVTVSLRDVKMIKNNQLESVIEMFEDAATGAGHVAPLKLHQAFSGVPNDDFQIVNNVAKLHSFDVYSLRISLRDLGIKVNDHKHLQLSPGMKKELDVYVRPFTERLIRNIYGGDTPEAETVDVTQLLKDPDVKRTRAKLKLIATQLKVGLGDVPQFLEDYGDIYLSIAYYRHCMDDMLPLVDDFVAGLETIMANHQLRQNPDIANTCKRLNGRVQKIREVLQGRFQLFAQTTDEMWQDMSAENFANFKVMVEENHAALGGLLCKLTVKMNAWHGKFPSRDMAGPARMADFVLTDMRHGF